MEHFVNAGCGPCVVLKRTGDLALICITDATDEPYVVPYEHVAGRSDWWRGRYFGSLEAALAYFNENAKESTL